MEKAEFTLVNDTGLHARPAALLEEEALRYKCDVVLEKDGEVYDAKSVIDILCAAAAKGDVITVSADGPDEKEALAAIMKLLAGFDE